VNAADHQDAAFEFDIADGFRFEPAFRGRDLTRFQRASEGTGESTGGSSDDVVEGGGVLFASGVTQNRPMRDV
jgi:hypothetical protein